MSESAGGADVHEGAFQNDEIAQRRYAMGGETAGDGRSAAEARGTGEYYLHCSHVVAVVSDLTVAVASLFFSNCLFRTG